jgi:LysR family transcriptional regulator (chromosome initiation inhibitor)
MNTFDPAALDCLAALAATGSFDRAAEQLSVTQSAVSQRLRVLETGLGRLLVVRSRPLRLTESGKVLLRYARQMQALRADVARELGNTQARHERLPIAVNADSLATWVLPALDEWVQRRPARRLWPGAAGRRSGLHPRLPARRRRCWAASAPWPRRLRGCSVLPLGSMRYVAVASPAFLARQLPRGPAPRQFHHGALAGVQPQGRHASRLGRCCLRGAQAASERALRAVHRGPYPRRTDGLGRGRDARADGRTGAGHRHAAQAGAPRQVSVDVLLHWHQWKLRAGDSAATTHGAGALDRIGLALAAGAQRALRPA